MPEVEEKVPTTYPTKPPLDKKFVILQACGFWYIKNSFLLRFRPNAVKAIIQGIVNDELSGKQYDASQTSVWTRTIADKIKHKIKGNVILVILIT